MRELRGSTARTVVVVTLIATVLALAFDQPVPAHALINGSDQAVASHLASAS